MKRYAYDTYCVMDENDVRPVRWGLVKYPITDTRWTDAAVYLKPRWRWRHSAERACDKARKAHLDAVLSRVEGR